jgi:arylsulfatase
MKNLECYGYERKTSPTIYDLASDGVLFKQHYSQASKTCYSVPSYMTGKYFPAPCFSNRYNRTVLYKRPPEDEFLFGEIMRENGYASAMFTNMPVFLPTDRLSKSFDEAFIWKQGETVLLQRWAVMTEKLHAWLESKKDVPFFLYIHAADTHFPHEMVAPYDQWIDPEYDTSALLPMGYGQNYRRRDNQPFTEADLEYFRAVYDGMILDADDQVRLLLDKLEQLGLSDNTIVLVTADHGQLLGENGYTVAHSGDWDEVLQVPWIMKGPGIPAGAQVDALTENTDIVPTLVELLSLNTMARFDGNSQIAAMRGNAGPDARLYIFASPDRSSYERPESFIFRSRTEKYRFDSGGRLTQVFQVPDTASDRREITGLNRPEWLGVEARLRKEYLPLLETLRNLPVYAVVMEGAMLAVSAESKETVVDFFVSGEKGTEELEKDNKWAYTDGFLWVRNDKETAPPLSFSFEIPDAVYTARLRMFNSLSYKGLPASSLIVQFDGEPNPRSIVCASLPEPQAAVTEVSLGKIMVTGGHLSFTLEGGGPGFWTLLHSIELIPEGAERTGETSRIDVPGATPEDASEYHELIRGLGYL